jgi:hypothetical protein
VGTQALQVIEIINYLLDCHAGGRGFESRPLRLFPPVRPDRVSNGLFRRHRQHPSIEGIGRAVEVRALVVEEPQVVMHEGDELSALADL